MRFDKPIVAFVLGAAATIPQEIITWIMHYFGVGTYSVYQLNSLIITLNRPNEIIGIVSTFLVGGIISTVFYYSLKRLGLDYLVIKSTTAGLIGWIISETFFTWLLEGPKLIEARPINDYFLQISGSIVFGIVLGFLYKKYLVSSIRQLDLS